jgi:lysozyme family protein
MADFDVFLPMLLGFEGGFVDDPADPGGATNKGITLITFGRCAQSLLSVEPSLDNLKALTDAQAGIVYNALYWNPIHAGEYSTQNLANIVCDFYVNAGANATKLLQSVLNGLGAALTVDGAIGPASLRALANADADEVYRRYKAGRIAYYQNLVARQPSLSRFLKGWLNRVNSFPDV